MIMRSTMVMLAFALFLGLMPMIGLAEANTEESERPFSLDTKITKENIDKIIEYYNIDPSNVTITNKNVDEVITVKEFEEAIKKAEQLPEKITCTHHFGSFDSTKGVVPQVSTESLDPGEYEGLTVAQRKYYEDSNVEWQVQYDAAGEAYMEPVQPYYAYWTDAYWGDVEVTQSWPGLLNQRVGSDKQIGASCKDAGTLDSEIVLECDYTIEHYTTSGGVEIVNDTTDIEADITFDISYI